MDKHVPKIRRKKKSIYSPSWGTHQFIKKGFVSATAEDKRVENLQRVGYSSANQTNYI